MIKRAIALCDDKYIFIESLYKVIDGEQINDPKMLDYLRSKGRNKELLCPCRCGKHLMLVAGPLTTRSQHFREYPNEEIYNCVYSFEKEEKINSRINLKCWMDENFGSGDLELRTKLSDDDRTALNDMPCSSVSKKVAVKYYHEHVNLRENEIETAANNKRGYKVIHVVGPNNRTNKGQYPEGLVKIQEKQGYVLILSSHDDIYRLSEMKAVIYVQNLRGTWEEITVVESDFIQSYSIDSDGQVLHNGEFVGEISKKLFKEYEDKKRNVSKSLEKTIEDSKRSEKIPFLMDMEEIRKKYLVDEQKRHEEESKKRRHQNAK